MTIAHITGLLFLLIFGFLYDLVIEAQIRRGTGDFTARFVVLGCAVTILVAIIDSLGLTLPAEQWGVLMFAHFAASGTGMTLGSWRRRR